MSDLDDLLRDPDPSVVDVLRVVAQAADVLRRHEQRLDAFSERLLLVDELPAAAPFGALLRLQQGTVAERLPLYLGNGPNQPLTKLTPVTV